MLFTNSSPQQLIYSLHRHMMDGLFLMPLLGTATVLPNARRYFTRVFNRNRCHLLCSGALLITADRSSPASVSGTFLSQRSETFPFVKMEKVMEKVLFVNVKKVVSICHVYQASGWLRGIP